MNKLPPGARQGDFLLTGPRVFSSMMVAKSMQSCEKLYFDPPLTLGPGWYWADPHHPGCIYDAEKNLIAEAMPRVPEEVTPDVVVEKAVAR